MKSVETFADDVRVWFILRDSIGRGLACNRHEQHSCAKCIKRMHDLESRLRDLSQMYAGYRMKAERR